jgi:hypothetical protein
MVIQARATKQLRGIKITTVAKKMCIIVLGTYKALDGRSTKYERGNLNRILTQYL